MPESAAAKAPSWNGESMSRLLKVFSSISFAVLSRRRNDAGVSSWNGLTRMGSGPGSRGWSSESVVTARRGDGLGSVVNPHSIQLVLRNAFRARKDSFEGRPADEVGEAADGPLGTVMQVVRE